MADEGGVTFSLMLAGPAATDRLGAWFADHVRAGDIMLLSGPIGAGKTHFSRALIRTILSRQGIDEDVPSPTYTLVQTYATPQFDIVHADLYRLGSPQDLSELGLEESFPTCVTLIEWPDRMGRLDGRNAVSLAFEDADDGMSRAVRITAHGKRWEDLVARLRHEWGLGAG